MLKVYSSEYARTYHAPLWSTAYFCCAIAFLITLFLPFFLAYATKQFWVKSGIYYEQPRVRLTGEIFVNVGTGSGNSLSYATLSEINQQFANSGITPIIETSNEDSNHDGLNDVLTVRAIIPLSPATVAQVGFVIGIHYELRGTVKRQMQSAVFLTLNTAAGAGYVKSIGDLRLVQKKPLPISSASRAVYATENVFSTLAKGSYMDAMKAYQSRNETLEYSGTTIVIPYGDPLTSTVEVKMKIPSHQEVAYETGLVEMIKSAWIQYLYMLIPVYFVMYELIVWIIIKFKIIPSQAVDDPALAHHR